MARNPFEFLDSGSRERTLLLLLLALIRKGGGELELTLQELTAIDSGDSFIKYPGDSGTSLVLRFARKGAEAFFLQEKESEPSTRTSPSPARYQRPQPDIPLTPPQHRAVVHDNLDLALREEEMAQRAAAAAKLRQQQARAESGALPWRTVKPQ